MSRIGAARMYNVVARCRLDFDVMADYPALHSANADFASIQYGSQFYVDKTRHFRRLLEPAPGGIHMLWPRQLLTRPRRFGKTLLIDTMDAWFQGLPPDKAGQFADAGVRDTTDTMAVPDRWASPRWLWSGTDADMDANRTRVWRPVLRIDMSEAAAAVPGDTEQTLRDYLWELAYLWGERSGMWSVDPDADTPNRSPRALLRRLIQNLHRVYGVRPVVLVDEYDAPVTEHMGTETDPAAAVGALRRCYRALKDDANLLYGVFATGITRVARADLFSAANNFETISDWGANADLCGFTQAEAVRCLLPHRRALCKLEPRLAEDRMLADWRRTYNGYEFSPDCDTPRIYNPFTLVRGVERLLAQPRGSRLLRDAANGLWPSAWNESGHPGLIVRLADDSRNILPDADIVPPPPDDEENADSLDAPDFARLMLDTGYYTWRQGSRPDTPRLDFPNREVARGWVSGVLGRTLRLARTDDRTVPERLRACLERGDVPGFAQILERFAFGLARENLRPGRDLVESPFRMLLQALFKCAGIHTVAEKSTVAGRPDFELHLPDRIYIVEVKFNQSVAAARLQIRERRYGLEHLGETKPVTAVGLAFRYGETRTESARLEYTADRLADLLGETTGTDLPAEPRTAHDIHKGGDW